MGVDRARLLADNVELDQRAAELTGELAAATQIVEERAAQEAEAKAGLASLEEVLRSLRMESQSAQEQRSNLELELVRRQSDLKHLDETSRKELGLAASEVTRELIAAMAHSVAEVKVAEAPETAAEAAEEAGENAPEIVDGVAISAEEVEAEAVAQMEAVELAVELPLPSLADVEEAEQQYAAVRQKIDALGPVNPQALEEYEESQERYEFLNTQRQDLLDSIRDTEKAIQELDTESRRRFKDAFEAINAHFKEMFRTLFGGGQGEMRLTDETNLAESGIDIMASPPGKKLQHVALLSGGEKSLTAMALLMAIFRYVPSPFCILDEVDAPLDESNIQRLTRLIKEMSHDTQFIVITHAKRTMEVAQALYGVTMQEPGVSKLVSVKFDPVPETHAPASTAALAAV
jgi:chromosome segregation protein